MLLIVFVFTAGILWFNRNDTPPEEVKYSNYNFTFTHNGGGYVFLGSDQGREQTYSSGSYGVYFENEDLREIGVYWLSEENIPVSDDESLIESGLNMKLDAWVSIGESFGAQFSYDPETISSEKDGHEIIYVLFELDFVNDLDEFGIMGAWECKDRIFIMYIRHINDVENTQVDTMALTEIWNQQLSYLKCG